MPAVICILAKDGEKAGRKCEVFADFDVSRRPQSVKIAQL
jgi:hypothetical protein